MLSHYLVMSQSDGAVVRANSYSRTLIPSSSRAAFCLCKPHTYAETSLRGKLRLSSGDARREAVRRRRRCCRRRCWTWSSA